tara:strand:- start:116 stop:778 length:663 start_codon:yes stop_codon:yes gene_type:complete
MNRFAIIVFPGSNCDHDAYHVVKSIDNTSADFIWHKETDLKSYDAIIVPGGFSYGDYLRAGAIARFSPIMRAVIDESKKGKKIIGICNGFQILIECGLLPGSLLNNINIKFLSKNVSLEVVNNESSFTHLIDKKDVLSMPIAHRQGNYFADKQLVKELEDNNQIAFKYKYENPNGSISDIAGILNSKKNVLGMMPHPERASDSLLGSRDGYKIFQSIVES